MKRILCALALFAMAGTAGAATLQLNWSAPTEDCEGIALDATQLANIEIYVDTKPIPGPANAEEACTSAGDPPPSGFTPTVVPVADGSAQITVQAGQTYYVRARVQAKNGVWSGMSAEAVKEIPPAFLKPPAVIILNL